MKRPSSDVEPKHQPFQHDSVCLAERRTTLLFPSLETNSFKLNTFYLETTDPCNNNNNNRLTVAVIITITILLQIITIINALPISCVVKLDQKAVISFGLNKTRKDQDRPGVLITTCKAEST